MDVARYVRQFRTLPRVVRQLANNGTYAVNEELFWDQYVKDWEKSQTPKSQPYVGSEWKNDEDFLSLLTRYSSAGKNALEIGCGGGRITSTGVKLFKHVYAADISEEMLRKCKESIAAANVSFHKLDGFTLGHFAAESVDCVYSHDVFVQLSSIQVYPYLGEIRRVLRPGGIGLISFYDFVGRFDLFRQWSLKFWNERKPPIYRRLHFVTEEMLRAMLSDWGLQALEAQKGKFLTVVFGK
ncbi:MAG TPA: class I SAM-dependent methyltransferase [Methylomirabilota bacterium]|nr:class I SAM-dependent methyltransferase [Methylomirabilota bacterium]